jgi:hypothetical protein
MKVNKIENLNLDNLMEVLSSTKITDSQKAQFVMHNKPQIEQIMDIEISNQDFKALMHNRSLVKFRPLKNSFTKKGDKLILAKALGINPSDVSSYIKRVSASIQNVEGLTFLSPDKMDMLKTYVYRHGSKDEIVNFLDYELEQSKDKIRTLYRTLTYYSGGIADYFIRPIHRMDNNTLIKVFRIIDKHIKKSITEGNLTDADSKLVAKWALVRIYKIQNNSKLINAIKTYNELK